MQRFETGIVETGEMWVLTGLGFFQFCKAFQRLVVDTVVGCRLAAAARDLNWSGPSNGSQKSEYP